MIFRRLLLQVAAFAFAAISIPAVSQIVTNGSFESPAIPTYEYGPTGSGWTFAQGGGIQHNGSAWGASAAPDGQQTAFLQGTGYMSQSLTLSSGTYTVNFSVAQRASDANYHPVRVSVDGQQVGYVVEPASTSFQAVSLTFSIQSSGAHTLMFQGTNEDGRTTFVDAVQVIAAPSCTGIDPQAPSTTATSGLFRINARGVTNATSVSFPTWGETGGQDDLVWYAGNQDANGTWYANVDLGHHKVGSPEFGTFTTDVYMTGNGTTSYCGRITWTRTDPNATPSLPVGSVQSVNSSGVASGTAYDPDVPSQSITVKVYSDGAPGIGTFVGSVATNGSTRNFSIQLPQSLHDRVHSLWAYAVDSQTGAEVPLFGHLPFIFVWGSAPTPPAETINAALWMIPTHVVRNQDGSLHFPDLVANPAMTALFDHPEKWAETRSRVKVIGLYASTLQSSANDYYLQHTVIPRLREWGIKLSLQVAGQKQGQCHNEGGLWESDRSLISRINNDLGGHVDFLVMDSAISDDGIWSSTCTITTDQEVNTYVVPYVAWIKDKFPGIRVGMTDPLPWRADGSHDEIQLAMTKLVSRLSAAGTEVDFFQADDPYQFACGIPYSSTASCNNNYGGFGFIKTTETFVQSVLRMPFAAIYNTDDAPSNQVFHDKVLAYHNAYMGVGGSPSFYVVQSWYPVPDVNVPEDDSEPAAPYSMTRTTRDLARLIWGMPQSPPATPVTMNPTNTSTTANPTYTWNASSGATSYQLRVGNTATDYVNQSVSPASAGCAAGTGACSFSAGVSLPAGSTVTWLVSAANAAGASGWSAPRSFTTPAAGGGPPAKAVQIGPSGTNVTVTPTFTWNAAAGAATYGVYVTTPGGVVPINQAMTAAQAGCGGGTGTCSFAGGTALDRNTTYNWAVSSNNSAGSVWSDGLTFTTTAAPAKAVLIGPSGAGISRVPTFTWNASPGTTVYIVAAYDTAGHYAINDAFLPEDLGCGNGTGTCSLFTPVVLGSGTSYTWAVESYNSYGRVWSDAMTFTTAY